MQKMKLEPGVVNMTKFQRKIALKLVRETKTLTWEEVCERIAIEFSIAILKMQHRLP
jgi:hypothetical protein